MMNTKWKVICSVMLLITIICTVFVVLVQQLNDDKLEAIIAGKKESASLMAQTLLSDFSQVYRDRIKTFTNPNVSPSRDRMIQAFADRDRQKLYQMSKPLLEVFKKNPHFATIGWILPDNRVFLRIHAPDLHGDDVSSLRPDIVAVNRDQKQRFGFDAGVSGMQYRVVHPVFYRGKYIGLVQFGIKASFIFDTLQEKLQTHAGMAVLNNECATVLKSRVPKLVCRQYTIRARDVEVYLPLKEQLDWNREQQRLDMHGEPHVILNILPVNNYQGEQLGVFFVALNIAREVAQTRKLLITTLAMSGLILIISFLILYYSYGSLVEKIVTLNESLERNNLELEDRVLERTAELQESENRMQVQKERLESITENVPGVVYRFSSRNGRGVGIRYTSSKLQDIFDLAVIDDPLLLMQTFVANIHQEDRQSFIDSVHESFEKQAPWNWSGRYTKSSGETIWFEGHGSAPRIRNDELISNGILLDVTSVQQLEEEKNKTERQLHRAQKMEAIGLMAGGVAHDLNNILSGVVSYPDLLLLKLPESSELRKPIQVIQESGRRAAAVVADLLTVARGVASTKEVHDINKLIHEYLESPECRKLKSCHPAVRCTEQLDADPPFISCSQVHIKKTVMNLMTNAVEAVGDHGRVRVATFNRLVDSAEMQALDLEPGNYVVVAVQDDGPGIAGHDLEHIFEPFYTRKVMGQSGTGLGLAVVWNTMEDHGGKIQVESSDAGTTFFLYFPVSNEEQSVQTEEMTIAELMGNNEYILVVDDEPHQRIIAGQMLRILGYTVDSVNSGEEAIEFVKETAVDLLVIDMLMEPGINGRQTYEEIRKVYPDQKVVIVSGFSESDDIKRLIEDGVDGFVKKPYTLAQLGRAVLEALQS